MNYTRAVSVSRFILVILCIALVLSIAVCGVDSWGLGGIFESGTIRLGLDLSGGSIITYSADTEDTGETLAKGMDGILESMRTRLDAQGLTEANVYLVGDNMITLEIPSITDPNEAVETFGAAAVLTFRDADGNVFLEGKDVVEAEAGYYSSDSGVAQWVVSLELTDEGAEKFAAATKQAAINKTSIYTYMDDEIISTASVASKYAAEGITGGKAEISGNFTRESAGALAGNINAGALQYNLKLEELRAVGPTLGEKSLETSLKAGAVGLLLVVLFMILYYRVPGLMASIALCAYTGLFMLALSVTQANLTLPGIAGIILSIGMAVDANVIIFTRIKEEIGLGKTVKSAIKTGFAKALSAIIDGNVTTLIAAAVLYWRGSGTVKGFATTLAIGIVLSMFTALFVTKFVLNALYDLGFTDKKFYGTKKEKKAINFLGKRNVCFIISLVMIGAGVAGMVMNKSSIGGAFNYGLDFKGGTSTSVTFNEDMSLERISSEVVPVVEGVTKSADTQTQKVAGTTEVIIKTRTLSVEERQALDAALVENFGVDESKIVAESISGAISAEMKSDAIVATVIATIFMLLYIWVRFKNIRFAASAVIALVHDVLVVVACYALAKWSVGSTAIACLLTIVGYSINATIVIFDRIRENLKLQGPRADLKEVVNESITQTFTRSINTSLTTFVMVLVLFVMGVSSIREFALPLMAGIICGTYSSVCLTGALWYVLTTRKGKKAAEKSGK